LASWRTLYLIAVAILGVSAEPVAAQGHDEHTFAVNLGYFFTTRDTKTRIDSEALGFGTVIDFEDDLGLDSSDSVFRIDGHLDITERHKILFSIYDLSRRSSKVVENDLQVGDTTFPFDTFLETSIAFKTYKISYAYSIIHNPVGHIDLSIGTYVADIRNVLIAENINIFDVRELTAPLPVFGVRGAWYFADRWSLIGSAELFGLKLDDTEGRLSDLYLGVEYNAFDHVAFGVAFNDVRIDIDTFDDDFTGSLEWEYSGALAFVKVTF
jgi:hypothetical protein